MHYFKQFIILFASLIISGCSLLNGSPESPIDIDKISAEITPKLEKFDSNQITDPSTRNIAISQALTVKYPPAKPGALCCEPLKAVNRVANAALS